MQYLGLLFTVGTLLGMSMLFFRKRDLGFHVVRVDLRSLVAGVVLVGVVSLSVATPMGLTVAVVAAMLGSTWGASLFNWLRRRLTGRRTRRELAPVQHPWVVGLVAVAWYLPGPTLAFTVLGVVLSARIAPHYVILGLTLALPPTYWRWTQVDTVVFLAALVGVVAVFDFWPQPRRQGREPEPSRRWTWVVIVLTVFILGTFYLNRYVYHGFGVHRDIFRHGSADYPFVVLTFDDGPNPRFTPQILDILKEKEVPAVFFVVGRHVGEYPDIARRIVEGGQEIGNHTYDHANVLRLRRE